MAVKIDGPTGVDRNDATANERKRMEIDFRVFRTQNPSSEPCGNRLQGSFYLNDHSKRSGAITSCAQIARTTLSEAKNE
ncbi:hypothetical protein [uncultured Slackia sp.]|uniref:hypothetical protein n=1 Tax=uncultured Slackia sp. TaxID=665903 RepID=UPI0026DF2D9A|nr:hypothetical protein [uncultured Slackia sp.]